MKKGYFISSNISGFGTDIDGTLYQYPVFCDTLYHLKQDGIELQSDFKLKHFIKNVLSGNYIEIDDELLDKILAKKSNVSFIEIKGEE